MRPILPPRVFVYQRLPSGPAVMPNGSSRNRPVAYCAFTTPSVPMTANSLPLPLKSVWVVHRLPSGPAAIATGLFPPGIGNCVTAPVAARALGAAASRNSAGSRRRRIAPTTQPARRLGVQTRGGGRDVFQPLRGELPSSARALTRHRATPMNSATSPNTATHTASAIKTIVMARALRADASGAAAGKVRTPIHGGTSEGWMTFGFSSECREPLFPADHFERRGQDPGTDPSRSVSLTTCGRHYNHRSGGSTGRWEAGRQTATSHGRPCSDWHTPGFG